MNLDFAKFNQCRAIFVPAPGVRTHRHMRCKFILYTILLKRYIRSQYDKNDSGKDRR